MQLKRNDAPTEISTIDHVAEFIMRDKIIPSDLQQEKYNISREIRRVDEAWQDKISNASDVQRGEHSIMSRWWVVNADSNYRMEASPFTKNASRTPMTRRGQIFGRKSIGCRANIYRPRPPFEQWANYRIKFPPI